MRAADFLINGRKLYLAAADAGRTLRLWSYEQHAQSWGGKRLLPLCALVHANEVVNVGRTWQCRFRYTGAREVQSVSMAQRAAACGGGVLASSHAHPCRQTLISAYQQLHK